jgi:type VI secretion system protein ImpI/type VI secretion system protein
MPLTLTVLRCPPSVAPEVRQVTGGEYSIGRGAENDWVLPDPAKQISKRHCVIAFRRGTWQIAGTSTNGTFINRDDTPLESRSPHTLVDGDRLILGSYEIEARLFEETQPSWNRSAPAPAAKPDPFGNPFDNDPFATPPLVSPPASSADLARDPYAAGLPAEFNPLLPDDEAAFAGPTAADHSAAVSDAIQLPPVRTALPDDWDLDDLVAPQAAPPPIPQPAAPPPVVARPVVPTPVVPMPAVQQPPDPPAAPQPVPAMPGSAATNLANTDLMTAFLRGAGLDNVGLADPVKTMEQLGAAFRATVSGIRHALIARSEVKREFRIEATMIRRRGNNVLKFSADDDDALTGLLGAGRRTDMGPEEAITEALNDMRMHELATMTAMQTAVHALVERLGPDQVRDPKESGGALAMLGNRKAKSWDAYEALHAQVLRGLADDFDSVFGSRFALAYEQAMQELAARKTSRRDDR